MIIVDACAWVDALVMNGSRADAARDVLSADPQWVAPAHMPLEVLRTLRRGLTEGLLTEEQASRCASVVCMTPLELVSPGAKVLSRTWTLRHTVSIYDAPYVALAEAFEAPLVTVDARLARAARTEGIQAVVPGEEP